ncbi:glycosyltransferase family 4 protein [Shimia sp. W99]
MPGDGTKTAITTSNPPARLLELTRALSVFGGRPSGVDRVCLAYLKALSKAPAPCFGLARTRLGYVLLDPDGVRGVLMRLEGRVPWGEADLVARILRRSGDYRRQTEADLRRLCIARCPASGLARMLRRHLPAGSVYLNVDQANFSQSKLQAIKSVRDAKVTLFLHDAIPLDYPEYQTPQSVLRFRDYLSAAQSEADLILTNSDASVQALRRHISQLGSVPPIQVAHLGVEVDFFQNEDNPEVPAFDRPYMICLGTIEPRKNVGQLLDIWERFAKKYPEERIPHLVICGRRGWMMEAFFERLEASPLSGSVVHEFNDLNDTQVFALLRGAAGMVFPSLSEGFGLPPVEAASLGVPVICNDLPVLREILHDYPIYAAVTDSYSWEKAIMSLAWERPASEGPDGQTGKRYIPPTWESHFNTVLRVT